MNRNDDSDIKIFGATSKSSAEDSQDIQRIAEETARNRQNGNTDKAKALGFRLALLAPDTNNSELDYISLIPQEFQKQEIMDQVHALIVFCAESSLHNGIQSSLLLTTAINAMYDTLISKYPELYERISDGIAFSFYYLSLNKGEDVATYMGVSFAMLCSMEDDEALIELGAKLYMRAAEKIKAMIIEVEFV